MLIDDSQNIVAAATRIVTTELGSNGWAEQNPSNWIGAAVQVFGELRSSAPSAFRKTQAISLSGQMHTLVALDETHKPLRPAILWNDTRGAEWCESVLRSRYSAVIGYRRSSHVEFYSGQTWLAEAE
ncbi:hypothetical protein LP421_33855 (plasmid) [Rhizobium sp. RCAM05350]|nr:hypothetical protein LP421_33855 [Rhizobium sp. RCAM05350]